MNSSQRVLTIMALSAAAALAGCFGGGGDDSPAPVVAADPLDAVPASATETVSGSLDYLQALVDKPSETREPLDVSAVVLPTSGTDEPRALQ